MKTAFLAVPPVQEAYPHAQISMGLARAGYTWDARELIATAMAR